MREKHCETAHGIALRKNLIDLSQQAAQKRSEINTTYSLEQCFVTHTNQDNDRKERT